MLFIILAMTAAGNSGVALMSYCNAEWNIWKAATLCLFKNTLIIK